MNETPTPPEGYRIIPRAYLEAGNPLPGDALWISRDKGDNWTEAPDYNWHADDWRRFTFATAQPLPCFQSPDQGQWTEGKHAFPPERVAPEPTAEQRIAELERKLADIEGPEPYSEEILERRDLVMRINVRDRRIAELERERDEARGLFESMRKLHKHAISQWAECVNMLRDARAQLAASGKDRQWQPIETAPKDGTKFLIWEVDFKAYRIAWWREHRGAFGDDCYQYNFTHWLPLRAAPTQSEAL